MRLPASLLIVIALVSMACSSGVGVGVGVVVQPGAGAVTANQMHLEWQLETRGHRTQITGYVYNDYVLAVNDIILLAESLDTEGRLVGQARCYVNRSVTPGMRAFFEVSVPASAGYRIEIASVRWLSRHRS
jgi:hypothetical protein